MDSQQKKLQDQIGAHKIKIDEPMSLHTTFKVGGPADLYYEAETTDDVVKAIKAAIEQRVPYFVFGGGSNILVSDKGIRGLVIRNKTKSIKILGFKGKFKNNQREMDEVYVEADAGIALNYLVRFTIEEGLAGLEVFLGLPGTVGGAVWNNSHYRQPKNEFVGNFVHSAKVLDEKGTVKEVDQYYFDFMYDYSILQKTHEIVLSVVFKLKPGDKKELWDRASQESVKKRHEEQPLEYPSAGCAFQNIKQADAMRLGTPHFTQSTGFLLDQAQLKGRQIGQAMVSNKHANFIVNMGGATATQIRDLIELEKQEIRQKFGVELHEEIRLVGEW